MNSLFSRSFACAVVLMALGATNQARAGGLLSVSDASEMIQSTATDNDVALLTSLFGYQPQTFSYSSVSAPTAWAGALSGTYLGSGLNVAYLGDLSSYLSTGAVTWTSAGTYGAQSWSGSGSATIADTSATTFNVTLTESLAIGTSTASMNYVIPGTVLANGTEMFGSQQNQEAGTGTVTLNGVAFLNILADSWYKTGKWLPDIPSDYYDSEGVPQYYPPFVGGDNYFKAGTAPPPSNGSFNLTGIITVNSVPEPSGFLLLSFGLFGVLGFLHIGTKRINRGSVTG